MSIPEHNPIPVVKPFGNSEDPRDVYQLLVAHVTGLAVHNFSKTNVEKRALQATEQGYSHRPHLGYTLGVKLRHFCR